MADAQTLAGSLTTTYEGRVVPVPGTYTVDASHTSVGFVARHLMVSKVRGSFPGVTGTLKIGETPETSSLEVDVDVTTVDTRDEQRDAHLRSPDFFDVERFPTMTFRATGARPQGDDWVVDGELTIKGVTRRVSLDVEFLGGIADPWGGQRIGFSASGEVDREDFDLGWNVVLEAGGVVVGKTIKLEIESELVRAN